VSQKFRKLLYLRTSLLILLFLSPAALTGQDQRLTGPLLGFVRDGNDLSIKPIFGVPGAATVGPALELPLHFFQVAFSLKNDFAIAVTESDSELVVLKNLSQNTTLESGFAGNSRIEQIALSPNGTYAALMSGEVIRVLRDLPSRPTIVREIRSVAEQQNLTALAVDDNGEVAAAFSDGMYGTVYWAGSNGELKPVAIAGDISALAFVPGRDGIVMADRLFNEISMVSDLSSNPSSVRLADAADDVSEPTAVEVSNSGSHAFVANQNSGTIVIIDFAGGAPTKLSCGCRATTLRALRGQSVFALTEPPGNPVMLFDGADVARVVVVSDSE
jgi:hypothetical protein